MTRGSFGRSAVADRPTWLRYFAVTVLIVLAVGLSGFVYVHSHHQVPGAGTYPGAKTFADSAPTTTPVVAFLGDSYTAGTGASEPALRWTTLVSAHEKWVEKNFGVGGTGYDNGGAQQGGTTYDQRVGQVAAQHPAIVIVSGGRNDIQDGPGVQMAISRTFSDLRAALPNATIYAISPVWDSTAAPAQLSTISAEVKASTVSVNGKYLDLDQPLAGKPTDIASDGVHPNDAGHQLLATAVEALLPAVSR